MSAPHIAPSSGSSWLGQGSALCRHWYATALAASAEQVRVALFWTFWATLVVFAVGPSVREIMPSFCLLLLLRYYYLDWRNSTLYRFPYKILLLFLALGSLSGVVFSHNVENSFFHVIRHLNKGFAYPLIAMECVRSTKELQRLIWAFVLAAFWQGLNGLWQSYTGFDFIDHTAIMSGRLTGSLSTYRVGNYMALIMVPALALWPVLRRHYSALSTSLCCGLLWLPALYILLFSYTRSGYLALLAGMCLIMYTYVPKSSWPLMFAPLAALVPMAFLVPQRLGASAVAGDGRWDLWYFGWKVFENEPWFGAGFGQYNLAFRALGYVPLKDELTISHPHNIYLQFLCESGIVGTIFLLLFLFGCLVWGYVRVRQGINNAQQANDKEALYHWRLTTFFWAGWGAFLVNGIFGHDFFRSWWFSLATILLGIMIGACMNPPPPHPPQNAPEKTADNDT